METKNFRRDILRAMFKKNIGLRELARQAGMDASFLSRILRGVREPPSDELIGKIAKALDLDTSMLMVQAGRAPEGITPALSKEKMPDYLRTIGKMTDEDWRALAKVIDRHLNRKKKRI